MFLYSHTTIVKKPRPPSPSGNLPNKITREEVLRVIIKKLGKDVVTDLRLSLDENKRPRGFGYIALQEEGMVEKAIRDLNGLDIGECSGW